MDDAKASPRTRPGLMYAPGRLLVAAVVGAAVSLVTAAAAGAAASPSGHSFPAVGIRAASRVAVGSAPLTRAMTESFPGGSSSAQVSTTSVVARPNYVSGALVVSWNGPGGAPYSLSISTSTPLTPGKTVDSSDASISSFTGRQCGPTGASSTATVDQLMVSGSTVQSLAVQFACATGDGSYGTYVTVAFNVTPSTAGRGYYLYEGDGNLTGFGNDEFLNYLGDLTSVTLNQPVVGTAVTPTGAGYWMVASDGGVFSFGDAAFYGSTGNLHLNRSVVGMAATPDGKGYWFVASDGGIFSYGDARFFGSTGNLRLNQPIVGMASTPDGGGYWLVASDGGIFSFGDAGFYGSTGNLHLNRPIVGMAAAPGGGGYWLVASDGGIFSFGTTGFYGSTGNLSLNSPIVGMTASSDGRGYWMTAADGGVFAFGDATFQGSLGGRGIDDVAGMVSNP